MSAVLDAHGSPLPRTPVVPTPAPATILAFPRPLPPTRASRAQGGRGKGLAIVAAIHVLLAWGLVSGLGKRVVDVVSRPVELAILTQAPPPPPPPPPKPAPPKPAPAPPPPPPKLDAKALQKLHDENMKRMMGQMDAPVNATGTAAHDSGPSANYWGRVVARLKSNLILTDSIPGNPAVEVEIRCSPDGTILSRRITKTSGSPAWDDAVLRAIDRAGKLPTDTNGKAPDTIPIRWHPQD